MKYKALRENILSLDSLTIKQEGSTSILKMLGKGSFIYC